jgi:hypothetical protein
MNFGRYSAACDCGFAFGPSVAMLANACSKVSRGASVGRAVLRPRVFGCPDLAMRSPPSLGRRRKD